MPIGIQENTQTPQTPQTFQTSIERSTEIPRLGYSVRGPSLGQQYTHPEYPTIYEMRGPEAWDLGRLKGYVRALPQDAILMIAPETDLMTEAIAVYNARRHRPDLVIGVYHLLRRHKEAGRWLWNHIDYFIESAYYGPNSPTSGPETWPTKLNYVASIREQLSKPLIALIASQYAARPAGSTGHWRDLTAIEMLVMLEGHARRWTPDGYAVWDGWQRPIHDRMLSLAGLLTTSTRNGKA